MNVSLVMWNFVSRYSRLPSTGNDYIYEADEIPGWVCDARHVTLHNDSTVTIITSWQEWLLGNISDNDEKDMITGPGFPDQIQLALTTGQ